MHKKKCFWIFFSIEVDLEIGIGYAQPATPGQFKKKCFFFRSFRWVCSWCFCLFVCSTECGAARFSFTLLPECGRTHHQLRVFLGAKALVQAWIKASVESRKGFAAQRWSASCCGRLATSSRWFCPSGGGFASSCRRLTSLGRCLTSRRTSSSSRRFSALGGGFCSCRGHINVFCYLFAFKIRKWNVFTFSSLFIS